MGPEISVIVSTLNRPEQAASCVKSVLANSGVEFELLVVDQSDAETRRRAMTAVGEDPRLRWISSETRGLSVSRNVGISQARGPVIAFTDDDCRVHAGWAAGIRAAFDEDREVGLLFGGVLLRPEDRANGYAAEFEPAEHRELHHRLPDIQSPWGVGANMAIRRTAFDRVGLFDPVLGAGAPFRAGEDADFMIRALSAGFKVIFTPRVSVTHLGIREGADAARLMRGYGVGLGAMLGKHVRLGTRGALRLLADCVAHHGGRSIRNALEGQRHPGFGLVASVMWGACRSYERRIDRTRQVYVS